MTYLQASEFPTVSQSRRSRGGRLHTAGWGRVPTCDRASSSSDGHTEPEETGRGSTRHFLPQCSLIFLKRTELGWRRGQVCTHGERDRGQQQDHRVHQAFAVDRHLQIRHREAWTQQHCNGTVAKGRLRKDMGLHHWSAADYKGPQCPGEAQTQQHIEYIATDGIGYSHVAHSWNHRYGRTQICQKLHLHLCH